MADFQDHRKHLGWPADGRRETELLSLVLLSVNGMALLPSTGTRADRIAGRPIVVTIFAFASPPGTGDCDQDMTGPTKA